MLYADLCDDWVLFFGFMTRLYLTLPNCTFVAAFIELLDIICHGVGLVFRSLVLAFHSLMDIPTLGEFCLDQPTIVVVSDTSHLSGTRRNT